jgi:hypothetical protein
MRTCPAIAKSVSHACYGVVNNDDGEEEVVVIGAGFFFNKTVDIFSTKDLQWRAGMMRTKTTFLPSALQRICR